VADADITQINMSSFHQVGEGGWILSARFELSKCDAFAQRALPHQSTDQACFDNAIINGAEHFLPPFAVKFYLDFFFFFERPKSISHLSPFKAVLHCLNVLDMCW
jgi:hypothetical protein